MDFIKELQAKIEKANHVAITTHTHPDADGIGSQLGLYLALKEKYNLPIFCVNEEALPIRYSHLAQGVNIYTAHNFKPQTSHETFDLLIVVDTNTTKRVGEKIQSLIGEKTQIIYIDHHPTSKPQTHHHLINPNAAATGQLICEVIKKLHIKITAEMALPLYTAILIDTNSFRYPTVSSQTHLVISELLDTGISPSGAYNQIYSTKSIHHTHFLGEILKNSHCNKNNEIAWIYITDQLQTTYSVSLEDSNAFINHLLVLDNIKVACMFIDDCEHQQLKLSLRSRGQVDVGMIAQNLGGGGHSHAAATRFSLPKTQDEKLGLINQSIKQIEQILYAQTTK